MPVSKSCENDINVGIVFSAINGSSFMDKGQFSKFAMSRQAAFSIYGSLTES